MHTPFFYLFVYLGRFNFWPVSPLVKEDLALSNLEIGVINAMLLWGFGLGDLVHGRLGGEVWPAVMDTAGSGPDRGLQLDHQLRHFNP